MKLLHTLALRTLLLFVVLFVIFLPMPFSLLPDSGSFLLPFTAGAVEAFGKATTLLPENYEALMGSDSAGMYVLTLLLCICSATGALAWTFFKREQQHEWRWLRTISTYYLALMLLVYGFDKVFKHQFYLPEPNTLYTPLGNLSPDLLFWSTAGTSWSFSFFTGLAEVISAALLLFTRTRGAGALMAAGIMLHVVLLNFSFDVSVKLLSLFLLLLAFVSAWPALKQLYTLLVQKQPVTPVAEPALWPKLSRKVYITVKTLLIIAFLSESLYGFVKTGNFNDDKVVRPFLHGTYEVYLQLNENNELVLPLQGNTESIRRIFIHRKGHLIFQLNDERMISHTLVYDTLLHQLYLQQPKQAHTLWNYELHNDTLVLKNNSTPEEIRAVRRDWQALPLLKRNWKWVSEE